MHLFLCTRVDGVGGGGERVCRGNADTERAVLNTLMCNIYSLDQLLLCNVKRYRLEIQGQ